MFVIGIGGIAGSGKSTAADFIEIESINHDCKPIRLSFADPVRAQAAEEAGFEDWRILKDQNHEMYRILCQSIADAGRPSKWVNIMHEKLKEIQKEEAEDSCPIFEERLVIIDDVRYPNELELVNSWQGVTLFIRQGDRPVEDSGAWRAHDSEWLNQQVEAARPEYADSYEWEIFNDRDEVALEKKLMDRLPAFTGVAPNRYSDKCNCTSCKIFRADVSSSEMIDSFREAIETAENDPDLDDESKTAIRETFTDFIEKLERGEITPLDLIFEEEDVDEDPDDSDS